MLNYLNSLEFESYKELKDYCRKNNILISLNDKDFQYLFENVLNYSQNQLIDDANEDLVNPYQYTL